MEHGKDATMNADTKVYLIGVGTGNVDTLTMAGLRAIEGADLLVGAPRLLQPFDYVACQRLPLIRSAEIARAVRGSGVRQACVLLSGDVGFYSGATALYDKLEGMEVQVIPGISSLVYFCSQLHIPWQDATLVSAHGREHNAVGAIQSSAKTFCITGGATNVEDICTQLVARGLGDLPAAAGERLSYADERIVRGTAQELARMQFADLSVLLVQNPTPVQRPFAAPTLTDADFTRGNAPMTKEEVRSLAICKLRIAPDHVVWDVGAGTGSVTVEAALAANRGTVYAIEKNADAIALLHGTKADHGVVNMRVVEGSAPDALVDLPAPDRVFVGGSSGDVGAIVDMARAANPRVRVCATAVTLETMADLLACVHNCGFSNVDIVQVSVARADPIGRYHLMRAENPVYIVTFEQGEEARR